jgi:hypothetical protein
MENLKFLAGVIQDEDKYLYVRRTGDNEAVKNLQNGNYITIIEPRQQGKTSLIYDLRRRSELRDFRWLYIDCIRLRMNSPEDWYQDLCERLKILMAQVMPECAPAEEWRGHNDWRNFLAKLAGVMMEQNRRMVIVLDEVGAIQFKGSNEFFAVLREIYNARGPEKYFQYLTFVLVGTFSLSELISNPFTSPFNVAVRIRLEDFSRNELTELSAKYGLSGLEAERVAKSIHEWTSGQPYLSQMMFYHLSSEGGRKHIASNGLKSAARITAEKILASDANNIRPMRERLEELFARTDRDYRGNLVRILTGSAADYFPASVRWQEHYELAGIIKRGDRNLCQIRCRLYEKFLSAMLEIKFDNRQASIAPKTMPEANRRLLQRRLQDLEKHIDAEYELLNEFEEHLMYSDNPRSSFNDRREIEKIKADINGHLSELESIQADLGTPAAGFATQVTAIETKLQRLVDLSEKIDHLDQSVGPLLKAMEAKQITQQDQQELLELVQEIRDKLPTSASEKVNEILSAPEGGISHKLKLSLPILYPFLSYEGEISFEEKANLEELVARIKEKLRGLTRRK